MPAHPRPALILPSTGSATGLVGSLNGADERTVKEVRKRSRPCREHRGARNLNRLNEGGSNLSSANQGVDLESSGNLPSCFLENLSCPSMVISKTPATP